jgi:hypothetical protein
MLSLFGGQKLVKQILRMGGWQLNIKLFAPDEGDFGGRIKIFTLFLSFICIQ